MPRCRWVYVYVGFQLGVKVDTRFCNSRCATSAFSALIRVVAGGGDLDAALQISRGVDVLWRFHQHPNNDPSGGCANSHYIAVVVGRWSCWV